MIPFSPTICVVIFVLISIFSTFLYPGSSQHDIQRRGFSWRYNYWCDILDKETYAGVPNPAYSWGILATLTLCIGTGSLFYQFPIHFGATPAQCWIISGFGILSMMFSALIFSPFHNKAIGVASALALIALIIMFFVLYQSQAWFLFYYGIFTCVVLLSNNYIYYSKKGIKHLPWIQKISILIVFLWIIMLNIEGVNRYLS